MPNRRDEPYLGLCAGPDGIWAVHRHGRRVLDCRFAARTGPSDPDAASADTLGEALDGLASPTPTHLSVALLPSWAPGRFIEAGGLAAGVAVRTSTRQTQPGDVVTAHDPGSGPRDGYAAHCPSDHLREIADALHRNGCAADAVTPADHAWCAAAAEAAGRANGRTLCVVELGGPLPETRILAAESGAPVALRRFPPEMNASGLQSVLRTLAAPGAERGERVTLLALGDAAFREIVRAAASDAGLAVAAPQGLLTDLGFDPGFVAAAYAGAGPRFVPPEVIAAARARRRRWSAGMAAAAVLLLGGAGVLHTLDVSRELDAVRAARAGIRDEVETALAQANDADETRDALVRLRDLRAAGPRWSGVLGDLSERLPAGTYATAVRTVGDSIFMEMAGEDAARAFEGIRGLRGFTGFRAAAPVRREVGEGSQVIERFTAAATVTWPRPPEPGPQSGGTP